MLGSIAAAAGPAWGQENASAPPSRRGDDRASVIPKDFGARGDGKTPDQKALAEAAAYLDAHGGGAIDLLGKVYVCTAEWVLPCGVDLIGPGTLKFTEPDGNGIYCSTNRTRKSQHSVIENVRFSRSGSNGGKAIYTQRDNAALYTQSPHWFVRRCAFLDYDAPYTLPPSDGEVSRYGWECCFDLSHSNGSVFDNNDVYGAFNPKVAAAGQLQSVGVRLGTDNTNGVIATAISMNRFWYLHTALFIGEDVLAFWFQNNECIKCFRGVYAPADFGRDGKVLQADTRVLDNNITTCTVGIDLTNRQLFRLRGNNCNSDPAYFDNGLGFTGVKLTNCLKFSIEDLSVNLARGHAAWGGEKYGVHLVHCSSAQFSMVQISRYVDDAIRLETSGDLQFDWLQLTQISKAGFSFKGPCKNIQIGNVQYVHSEPTNKYRFDDSGTTMQDLMRRD
ncbi:hypothetical protein ASG19_21705 [Rhizobium sp. Leaf306]|nr:hypothetical protein ASG19_21705 [Rhizobium sp. Leaf306]